MRDVILDPISVGKIALGATPGTIPTFLDQEEIADDADDGIDPARRARIMKAAEIPLRTRPQSRRASEASRRERLISKRSRFQNNRDSQKQADPKTKKSPRAKSAPPEVREQIRQQVSKPRQPCCRQPKFPTEHGRRSRRQRYQSRGWPTQARSWLEWGTVNSRVHSRRKRENSASGYGFGGGGNNSQCSTHFTVFGLDSGFLVTGKIDVGEDQQGLRAIGDVKRAVETHGLDAAFLAAGLVEGVG